jgi:hypothetical protein
MSRKSPAFEAAFPICKDLRCPIAAWGPETVVVEMKDSGRLEGLKSRLAPLGFHFHPDEDSQAAGLYDFSLSPEPVGKENNQFHGLSVIRLPFLERYQYLIGFLLVALAYDGLRHQFDGRMLVILCCLPVFLVCSIRNFSWKIEFVAGGMNVGSLFSKRFVRWSEISSIGKKIAAG